MMKTFGTKRTEPNWVDWLIYRLFYWRWNTLLANNKALRDLVKHHWEEFERRQEQNNVTQ